MHASSPPPGPLSASLFVEALRAHVGTLVACALIAHALLWTLCAGIAEPTPDPKIAMGLALGREGLLGYPGWPMLAPWLLQLVYSFIPSVFVMQALGPLAVALAGWLVFRFARRIVGEPHAALATLALVGVMPVSFPVGALDSAIVQMPLAAAMVLAWWRATREGSGLAWVLFGALAALAFYAGVQALFVLALLLVVSVIGGDTMTGRPETRAYMAAAFIAFLALAAPRLWWLFTHHFEGFYESPLPGFETLGLLKPYQALAGVAAGHLGLLLLALVATPMLVQGGADTVSFARAPLTGFQVMAVALLAVIPFFAAAAGALLLGERITAGVFAPLLLYSGLLAVLFAGETIRLCRQRLVARLAGILLVLPPLLFAGFYFMAPWLGRATMADWPAAEIARTMTESFNNRAGKPLELLIGPPVRAAEIALASKDRPHIYPNADPAKSPWIGEDSVKRTGAVVFWPIEGANPEPPPFTSLLPPFAPEAPLSLVLPGSAGLVRIGWAIIPPGK